MQLAITGPRHKFSFIEEESSLGIRSPNDYTNRSMILYPDIYPVGKYGFQKEENAWNESQKEQQTNACHESAMGEVASVLPLAKAMGAKVTPHLHQGVTHILCDIVCDKFNWHPSISTNTFHDLKRGSSLHQRLTEMNSDSSIDVLLISPSWIRSKWL